MRGVTTVDKLFLSAKLGNQLFTVFTVLQFLLTRYYNPLLAGFHLQ